MPHKGLDYETVILLKLGAMEGQLKSLMASMKEPLQKEQKRLYEINAPSTGTIREWYRGNGLVDKGEKLCRFEYWYISHTIDISSPARGYLRIEPGMEEGALVWIGRTIATVDVGVRV